MISTRNARRLGAMAAIAAACFSARAALAQNDKMTPMDAPEQPGAIELGTPELPGATAKESWHRQYNSPFARNVTVATLRPFLPDPAKATGAAAIVCPGGGFRTLSMENEGWDVAKALADKGVAAFVLKYRLNQTPASLEEFARPGAPAPRPPAAPTTAGAATGGAPSIGGNLAPQLEDADAAFALVRQNAEKWHVDPDRIGMVGFSAGAMLTMSTALNSKTAKPAFLGDIYGPLAAVEVPADAPPLFVAVASDDPLFRQDFGLVQAWFKAKRPVEMHYFQNGGHGFGMYKKETTSTGWFEEFSRWLGTNGFLAKKK